MDIQPYAGVLLRLHDIWTDIILTLVIQYIVTPQMNYSYGEMVITYRKHDTKIKSITWNI